MRQFVFSEDGLAEIQHDRYRHPHPFVQRKMGVLWLKAHGLPHHDIARLAACSARSGQRYLDGFHEGGLARVRQLNWAGKPNALAEHRLSLEGHFLQNPPRTAREAQKASRLDEAERGRRTVLLVDAAHFAFGPYLGHLWCLVRMLVKGPSGRKRYNVPGALDAVTRRVITVANDSYINALSVCELLRRVAAAGLPGPVTLVMDNARYQRSALVQALARQLGIELLFLPAYSPNLSLIERVWKVVKKEALASKDIDTYEEFGLAIEGCLSRLSTRYRAEMDTLLTLNFQLFDDVPLLSARSIMS
jgi:transposase